MQKTKEVWKDVKDYEGHYKVSNLGRVKSLKNKGIILKQNPICKGYMAVCLCKFGKKATKRVHQLMAVAFLNHNQNFNGLVVDHIDNDKLNNELSNLQIITHRENSSKDKKGGTSKYVGVHWSIRHGKWVSQISINNVTIKLGYFEDEIEASRVYQEKLK